MPGHFIGENVAFICDVVDYCSLSGVSASSFLDQEKAFDRMDWSFLCCILLSMSFGPFFVNGLICFIIIPLARLMLMVILVNLFLCLVASARASHCLRFCRS